MKPKIHKYKRPDVPDKSTPPMFKEDVVNLLDQGYIFFNYLQGFIQTTDTVPTQQPKKVSEQIRLYVSGATKRLYIYDTKNQGWYYVALT